MQNAKFRYTIHDVTVDQNGEVEIEILGDPTPYCGTPDVFVYLPAQPLVDWLAENGYVPTGYVKLQEKEN